VESSRPLAVLGATGYTGGLVLERARGLGLPLRLVGRRREALERLASDGDEVRVADARHERELIDAFEGAFAVASTAGPFLARGARPVAAAIAAGAHYLDISVEQAFTRLVLEGFDEAAQERGLTLLPSFGLAYVAGDFAARLAAEGLPEPLDEVVVAYASKGVRVSAGTRRTAGDVMAQEQVAWEDGLVGSRFGKTTRRIRTPDGLRGAVEFGGAEPLTVPRHTRVRSVRSYVIAPRVAAVGGLFAPVAAPVVRLASRVGWEPSPEGRARWRWVVVAEARSGVRTRRATLRGSDVYGLTSTLLARGAAALRAGEAKAAGGCAPAQAFDVRQFAAPLAPLLEIVSVDDG
jgi:short subunit dehydrogenase-like uncharacterized protein